MQYLREERGKATGKKKKRERWRLKEMQWMDRVSTLLQDEVQMRAVIQRVSSNIDTPPKAKLGALLTQEANMPLNNPHSLH